MPKKIILHLQSQQEIEELIYNCDNYRSALAADNDPVRSGIVSWHIRNVANRLLIRYRNGATKTTAVLTLPESLALYELSTWSGCGTYTAINIQNQLKH